MLGLNRSSNFGYSLEKFYCQLLFFFVGPLQLYFQVNFMLVRRIVNRRFPWGIKRWVSTYSNLQLQTSMLRRGLHKFQISGGGGVHNSKCQDLPKFQFSGWTKFQNRVFCPIWTKNSGSLASTDSVSHVETKKPSAGDLLKIDLSFILIMHGYFVKQRPVPVCAVSLVAGRDENRTFFQRVKQGKNHKIITLVQHCRTYYWCGVTYKWCKFMGKNTIFQIQT